MKKAILWAGIAVSVVALTAACLLSPKEKKSLVDPLLRHSEGNPYSSEVLSESYLQDLYEANLGADAEEIPLIANEAWEYARHYDLILHDDHPASSDWTIRLLGMEGTDALAQSVNAYHEELYRMEKAHLEERQKWAIENSSELSWTDFGAYNGDLLTKAAYTWGNIVTVVDVMDHVSFGGFLELPANFNKTTGKRYELADLFCTQDYQERLLQIMAEKYEDGAMWGSRLSRSTSWEEGWPIFGITYRGLLLSEGFHGFTALVEWRDIKDILSPAFISEVLVYADWEDNLTILDTGLQWTSYRDFEETDRQQYRVIASADDIYEYDKYDGDDVVIQAMCSYLASTGTQAQKKTWRLLERMTDISADGRLASVCFADGTQRVHLLVNTAEQTYSVVEICHAQDAVDTVTGDYALAPALAAAESWQETDDTLSGDGFFINAEQVYYDEYAEQDAARAVQTYAKEQGIEEEEWELVYLYSVNRSPRDPKCGTLHVFVRSLSSGRKLYLLLRGPEYQKNEWLVIADIQNGAAGAHELPDGFYHTSAQWHSYDAWRAHEREFTYQIRSDPAYNQYDSAYSFQLVCALEAYLTNTEADRTAVWEIDYEKFIDQESLADVWYTSADRQVHLAVNIADRMYAEIETYRQFPTKESGLSEAPEEITVDMANGESYAITKETFVIDHDHFLPEYSTVDYPIIKFSDDETNDRLGEKINRLFYETAMLHYDEELGQEINAEYACNYVIANADDDSVSILYCSTQGAGGGAGNQEYAVTVSLADGSVVSLADLGRADDMLRRLENYSGTIYYSYCEPDIWTEDKEKFVREWQEDEHSLTHGWYLHDGRIGFIFWYPLGNRVNTTFEFELL